MRKISFQLLKTWPLFFLLSLTMSVNAQRDSTVLFSSGTATQSGDIFQPERFSVHKLYAPSALILTGIAIGGSGEHSVKNEIVKWRNDHIPHFHTGTDNILQYAPLVISYGLDAAGVKSRTDVLNRSAIMIKGEIVTIGVTELLKRITNERRPNLADYKSFPSGHTTQAFAAATLLSEEYKLRFKWMPYVSYGIASSVGIMRMAKNKHYINDVLAGAGIGILSMKLAYWTHQYRWGRKKHVLLPN